MAEADQTTIRRSGNYQPSIWDDDFVQSLSTPYTAKEYGEKADDLKIQVENIIDATEDELALLELIDNLQRLDISYHFTPKIEQLLENVYGMMEESDHCGPEDIKHLTTGNLYFDSLRFRLLRQNGYHVPQDVFYDFLDDEGNFPDCLADDVRGLLSLYEASFLSLEGEAIMDLAKTFSTHCLKAILEEITNMTLAEEIRHALELPLHWRVQKLQAKWFISVYRSRSDANTVVLQFAVLDFNILQAKYQEEIKSLSRWYKETGFSQKLGFARHRMPECFLWGLGFISQPHLDYARGAESKIGALITIMDDIYDVYGTLDELEALTETIQRWDINSLDCLPEYQRIFFLALFNSANEMAYEILRDQGVNIISYLKKSWAELGEAYNLEARWYHTGYFPSLNEYLNMAWISISGPVLLYYAYLSIANPIDEKELHFLEQYPGIMQWPSMVLRLNDDLATASREMEKGDVPKSIHCCMRELGCGEEEAREYVKGLIEEAWKRMNKEIVMKKGKGVNQGFLRAALDLSRISHCMYQFGDGHGDPHRYTKENLASLVLEPIPLIMP